MLEILNIVSMVLLVLGCVCNLIAGFGIFYFPDVYSRMHATGIADTLGTGLVVLGLMLQPGWDGATGKLLLILLFTLLTSPTVTYVLANTALRGDPDNDQEALSPSQAKTGRTEPSNQ